MNNVIRLREGHLASHVLSDKGGSSFGDGPPPGGDDMESRLKKLELDHALLAERAKSLDATVEKGFERLSKQLEKLPSHWDMAKIVFYVVGALMAAAIWGPRALSMMTHTGVTP